MAHHHGIVGGEGFELVGGRGEFQVGDGGNAFGHFFRKTDGGGEARTYGGAALGELHQIGKSLFYASDTVVNLLGVAREFLTQCDGCCILRVGAADLDNMLPGLGLVVQGIAQLLQGREQAMGDFLGTGNVHGGGEGVV